MTLSKHKYDLSNPLSADEHAKLKVAVTAAKQKWKTFGQEDRDFILRLQERGLKIKNIWDVGASNGAWALMVANHFSDANVEMFEPLVPFDKSYYDMMRYQLSANPKWRLHPLALNSTGEESTIFVADEPHGSSLIESDYAKSNWQKVNIRTATMDDMIEKHNIAVPEILKADTQGYELEVLKGGVKHISRVKALILEAWLSRSYGEQTPILEELIEWLRPHGFILVEVNGGYRTPMGAMHSVDAYFLQKELASSIEFTI